MVAEAFEGTEFDFEAVGDLQHRLEAVAEVLSEYKAFPSYKDILFCICSAEVWHNG